MDISIRIDPLSVDIIISSPIVPPDNDCAPRSVGNYQRFKLISGSCTDWLTISYPFCMNTPIRVDPLGIDIIITIAIVAPGDYSAPHTIVGDHRF